MRNHERACSETLDHCDRRTLSGHPNLRLRVVATYQRAGLVPEVGYWATVAECPVGRLVAAGHSQLVVELT